MQAVVVNKTVYVGGGQALSARDMKLVQMFDLTSGHWKQPIRTASGYFAMASLNGQLLLVGGLVPLSSHVFTLDNASLKCEQRYPSMPTGRRWLATTTYCNFLITACGRSRFTRDLSTVEVLDTVQKKWYIGEKLPTRACAMSSGVIDNTWYISGEWVDDKPHVYHTSLPALVSRATQITKSKTATPLWQELTPPPIKFPILVVIKNNLFIMGGKGSKDIYVYQSGDGQWKKVGELPTSLIHHCAAVLPSGNLFLAGGQNEDNISFGMSKKVWIGIFET